MKSIIILFSVTCCLYACRQSPDQSAGNNKKSANLLQSHAEASAPGSENVFPDINAPENAQSQSASPVMPPVYTKAQHFSIAANRDTVIACSGGTRVKIPAFSLETISGKSFSERVQVSISEYYKKQDIFFAQLNTRSDGRMLESGGMIYINATSGSETLRMKEGKQIEIAFKNTVSQKSGMQTFYGETNQGMMNWKKQSLPNVLREETNENELPPEMATGQDGDETDRIFDIAGLSEMAEFLYENGNMTTWLMKNIRYPVSAKEICLSGTVYVEYVIEKNGETSEVKIRRGVHDILDKEALRVISIMPKWKPAKINGKPVRSKYVMPIKFCCSGNCIGSGTGLKPSYTETDKNKFEQKNMADADTKEVTDYVIYSASLGWINCDRFIKAENKTDVLVENARPEWNMQMIFHNYRSVLSATTNVSGQVAFRNIPVNEPVTIIIARKENGVNYISIAETRTGSVPHIPDFHPVTLAELKSEIEKITTWENEPVSMK